MHPDFIHMKKELVTINLKKVNITAMVLFIIPFVLIMSLKLTIFKDIAYGVGFWDYLIIAISYPVLLLCHECIHALAFLMSGAQKGSVRFGVIPKKMMLYCTTNKPLSVNQYKLSLLLPIIITGVIPSIIAMILLNWKYSLLFTSMISCGAGDLLMFLQLCKRKKVKMIEDHPNAPAFYALYDETDLPLDFKEVTIEDEEKLLKSINN